MGRPMNLALLIVVVTLLVDLPSPVSAEDARAKDAIDFFTAGCVATDGSKDLIAQKFGKLIEKYGNDNRMLKALPSSTVQEMQDGRPGGIGYAITSPHGAQLIVGYEARGICGVHVKEAEETSVQRQFEALVQILARRLAGEIVPQPGSTKDLNGYKTTFKGWIIKLSSDKKITLAVTTTDRPGRPLQHLMTFNH